MDNSPYAFPCEQHETQDGTWNQTFEPGMSLRDYFAAKAMQSLVITTQTMLNITVEDVVEEAYVYADAMLKVRNG